METIDISQVITIIRLWCLVGVLTSLLQMQPTCSDTTPSEQYNSKSLFICELCLISALGVQLHWFCPLLQFDPSIFSSPQPLCCCHSIPMLEDYPYVREISLIMPPQNLLRHTMYCCVPLIQW